MVKIVVKNKYPFRDVFMTSMSNDYFSAPNGIRDLDIENIIFGPPGTGKTYTLENLIFDAFASGKSFMYHTYSRSMGRAARQRIIDDPERVGTFHSLLSKKIGWKYSTQFENSDFLRPEDLKLFADTYGIKMTREWDVSDIYEGEPIDDFGMFLQAYDTVKNKFEDLRDILKYGNFNQGDWKYKDPVYIGEKYEQFKEKLRKHDYTDILVYANENPEILPQIDYLIVDEAQDLTPLMWSIIDKYPASVKVVAGDDDQAIYTYRGARAEMLLERRKFSKVFHLDTTYRLPDPVLRLAQDWISQVQNREVKYYKTVVGEGFVVSTNNLIEVLRQLATLPGSKFILARTNSIVKEIALQLLDLGIPYTSINPRHAHYSPYNPSFITFSNVINKFPDILDPADLKTIIKHLPASILRRGVKTAVLKDPNKFVKEASMNLEGEFNITTLFKRPMSKHDLIAASDLGVFELNKHLYDRKTLIPPSYIDLENMIRVDTIHSAKGLEADYVALFLEMNKKVEDNWMVDQDNERRVLYVGMTRAKKGLFLVFNPFTNNYSVRPVNWNSSRDFDGFGTNGGSVPDNKNN